MTCESDAARGERHASARSCAEMAAMLRACGHRERRRARRRGDIVAAVLDVPRFWALLHESDGHGCRARGRVRGAPRERRIAGAPFAYAVGRAAFRHLTLDVDERVLIPRQETELLVEDRARRDERDGGIAIDIGTGSGAIALALASEGKFERVIGTDVSSGALAVARANGERAARAQLRAPVELARGRAARARARANARAVIVSNPPYISFDEARALPASRARLGAAVALYSGVGRNGGDGAAHSRGAGCACAGWTAGDGTRFATCVAGGGARPRQRPRIAMSR